VSKLSARVLERLRRRDPDALREIVDEHARPLYRAARGMGFAVEEAEDLAQDVFVTFIESLDRFEGRAQIGTWLFGIRSCRQRRRSTRRDTRMPRGVAATTARGVSAAADGRSIGSRRR
jgi:DNA-directed RNA polymerase specialized sigma24 family protein